MKCSKSLGADKDTVEGLFLKNGLVYKKGFYKACSSLGRNTSDCNDFWNEAGGEDQPALTTKQIKEQAERMDATPK